MTMVDPARHSTTEAADSNPATGAASSAEATAGAAAASATIDPTEALTALQQDRDLQYERFLRAQAEFDNARKRWLRESDEQRKFQSAALIRDLLPVLDNLRRAVEAAQSGSGVDSLLPGIELVLKQVDDVFSKHEARPIEARGVPFDPRFHEAVTQVVSAEHPPMTVVQELERGYQLHDRVIRPSKVIVSQAAPAT
jgi:molecular chaperone GrpE